MKRLVSAVVLVVLFATILAPSEATAAPRRPISQGGGGPVVRFFATRLYYGNAFRGLIPGTGYGGFRRPAFGNRGY
jgi:hypothetical protein